MGQYEVLELHCPHQTAPETPAPVTVAVLHTLPSTTRVSPPVVLKPKVLCSPHQMTVEIPTGAIYAIYVKGLCINMKTAMLMFRGEEGRILFYLSNISAPFLIKWRTVIVSFAA